MSPGSGAEEKHDSVPRVEVNVIDKGDRKEKENEDPAVMHQNVFHKTVEIHVCFRTLTHSHLPACLPGSLIRIFYDVAVIDPMRVSERASERRSSRQTKGKEKTKRRTRNKFVVVGSSSIVVHRILTGRFSGLRVCPYLLLAALEGYL